MEDLPRCVIQDCIPFGTDVWEGPSGPSREGPSCRDKILSITKSSVEEGRRERERERKREREREGGWEERERQTDKQTLLESKSAICFLQISFITPKRIKLESCGWAQKKRLEIFFLAVMNMVTFGLRSSANRRLKLPSVIYRRQKTAFGQKVLPEGTFGSAPNFEVYSTA